MYTTSGLAWYRHADWLGSSRLASTPSQGMYYDGAYSPTGEIVAESGTADRNFTGQNADLNPDLYDFLFRELRPGHGRWVSPDPAGVAAVDPADPQGWNRYAYVGNRPMGLVDLLGLNLARIGDCYYDRTDFYVNGEYDSSTYELIGCVGGGGSGRSDPPRDGESGGGGPGKSGSGFGLRAPGQSFGDCMRTHASLYSLGGITLASLDLVTGLRASSNPTLDFAMKSFGGNFFTDTYFTLAGYSDSSTPVTTTALVGNVVPGAMGSPLSWGRRTADLMSLNLSGKGGLPFALGSAGKSVRNVLGIFGTTPTRLAFDAGLALAEGFGCMVDQ